MQLPIATPLPDPSAGRIAGLVLRLEEDPIPTLTLTTIAVRAIGGVQAYVICHLADGARERFSPSEARLMAQVLRDAAGVLRQLHAWADSLEEAADAADRQAAAILLGDGEGRGVNGFAGGTVIPMWRGRA